MSLLKASLYLLGRGSSERHHGREALAFAVAVYAELGIQSGILDACVLILLRSSDSIYRLEPAANESISAGKMTGPNFRSVVVPGRFRVVAEKDNVIDIAVTSEELSRIARYDN